MFTFDTLADGKYTKTNEILTFWGVVGVVSSQAFGTQNDDYQQPSLQVAEWNFQKSCRIIGTFDFRIFQFFIFMSSLTVVDFDPLLWSSFCPPGRPKMHKNQWKINSFKK